MSDKKKEPRVGLRPFGEILAEMAGGDVERELTSDLAKLVEACKDCAKPGKLVITLNVIPGPKMMGIVVDVKATTPRPPLEATQFYTDEKGGLHIENPRQSRFGFDGPRSILPEGD